MRLWSIHPKYLDTKALVACWREGLLARKVLQGATKGYRNHPQLLRFKEQADPMEMIDLYLLAVYDEAASRGYKFKREKIASPTLGRRMDVTDGQLRYELSHLKKKLGERDRRKYDEIAHITDPEPHPLFQVISGGVETWERVSTDGSLHEQQSS